MKKSTLSHFVTKIFSNNKTVVCLIIFLELLFFGIKNPAFHQYTTIISILNYSYYISFMAIGVTFCLITGGVDISIGTGMICCSLYGAYMIVERGFPAGIGIITTIIVGLILGSVNGWLVGFVELPPFIATLGTMMIAKGITGGMTYTWPAEDDPKGWVRSIFSLSSDSGRILPIGVLWILIVVICMSVFLHKTCPGRYIRAVGSNKECARLSGVNVRVYQMLSYIISGFFTGIAGIAYGVTFKSLTAGSGGGLELDAITAAVIGGVSVTGGAGSVFGTLLGVFAVSILKAGLPFIGLQANWQQIITGLFLCLAVWMDIMRSKK